MNSDITSPILDDWVTDHTTARIAGTSSRTDVVGEYN